MTFRALVIDRSDDGSLASAVRSLDDDMLPDGDVLIDVEYSTLNYKDGLALKGLGNLVKTYPHVPGIDFAGVVTRSAVPSFAPGDRVVLTGWRVGELHWGGYAERARVKGEWLVRLPATVSTYRAMAVGTAGLTAMLCLMALERAGVTKDHGDVLVTGAAGGVGSVAVALLSNLGYRVIASTGRAETHDYLRKLGAAEIIDRQTIGNAPSRPLASERWAAAIDTVGSGTLANVLSQTKYGGAVAACGLAQGSDLPTTVIPFIIRGVSLLGVDSVMAPQSLRAQAWERLAVLPDAVLDGIAHTVPLEAVVDLAPKILAGQVQGRVVVDVRS